MGHGGPVGLHMGLGGGPEEKEQGKPAKIGQVVGRPARPPTEGQEKNGREDNANLAKEIFQGPVRVPRPPGQAVGELIPE